jgi:hypothetical protein
MAAVVTGLSPRGVASGRALRAIARLAMAYLNSNLGSRQTSVSGIWKSVECRGWPDGIEPPTPAFSGLLTDNAKRFGINGSSWRTESYNVPRLGPLGID